MTLFPKRPSAREYLELVSRPALHYQLPAWTPLARLRVSSIVPISDGIDARGLMNGERPAQRVLEDRLIVASYRAEGLAARDAYARLYQARRQHNSLAPTVWFQREALTRGLDDHAAGIASEPAVMVEALEQVLRYESTLPTRRNARS